jgi:beta-N-acetylhexosaminidase
MNLEGLAGGVLWVGFGGSEPDAVDVASLAGLGPGGLVLFARNVGTPPETAALTARLRAEVRDADGRPPLLAIDQEGGRVARLRRGSPAFPSALALGAAGDPALAERAGLAVATELRKAGVDVDFAPVLDLLLDAANPAIGTRAFGDDPPAVGRLGAAWCRGLQRGGVASVLKHFPGHGASPLDSHVTLPRIDAGRATLERRELVPFRAGIDAGACGVMAGHLLVTALDRTRAASASRVALRELLRDELRFDGICFTDCLQMDAVAREPGTPEAALAALEAGADAPIVSHDLPVAYAVRAAIVQAVRSGRVPLQRLEEAHARLRALRERLDRMRSRAECEPDPAAVARLVAERAIALVRGDAALDPARVVNVVSFEGDATDGVGSRAGGAPLHLMLRERKIRAESMRVPLDPPGDLLEMLGDVISSQRDRRFVIVARRAYLVANQARAVDALLAAAPDAVLVSALEPFDEARFPQARTVVCTFGDDATTFEALADVLAGRRAARGRVPLVAIRA